MALGYEAVQAHRFGFDHLLTAEGQQLAGGFRGSLAACRISSTHFRQRVAAPVFTQQQIAIAVDDRQQVVKKLTNQRRRPGD